MIQEIFGVNSHIRDICDRLAARGHLAIAPALFDRYVRSFQCGYSPAEIEEARNVRASWQLHDALLDVTAAKEAIGPVAPVAVLGFCLGGSVAYAAAVHLGGLVAAVGFYGGMIATMAHQVPKCPVMLHFGEQDKSIPLSDVDKIEQERPDVIVHRYPAGHGFNCDQRSSYDAESAEKAWARSMQFLEGTFESGRRKQEQ